MELNQPIFTEKEQKLLKKMKKGNQDIQYLSSYDGDFLIQFGNTFVKTRSVVICHIREGSKICVGHIGGKPFKSDSQLNDIISIFIDKRLEEWTSLHIKIGDYHGIHSTKDDTLVDEVLLTFIEDDLNAQIIIFDGRLEKKLAEMIATKEKSRDMLRFLAMSFVTQNFPKLSQEWRGNCVRNQGE
ncbi:hypothetical protein [Bacillus cereus]|uniref:hypothetical protein n=1 Tax=Bacillus cereus TaxID=1396 RepID=UPI0011A42CA3|nr:hypothetical protein [Bacillus cereus]